jgi:hypothetical protein
MKNYKHAYWTNKKGEPCYTIFEHSFGELNDAILSNKAIVLDDVHDFIKATDRNLNFLSAYVFDFENKNISINMDIAKNIILGSIRIRRNQILKEMDVEQLKYMSNADKLAKIENVKKQLRDLPVDFSKSLDICTNFTDLKHIMPPILFTYKEMI